MTKLRSDNRFKWVKCVSCGREYQRCDFHGRKHVCGKRSMGTQKELMIDGTDPETDDIETGIETPPFYVFDIDLQDWISGPFTDMRLAELSRVYHLVPMLRHEP